MKYDNLSSVLWLKCSRNRGKSTLATNINVETVRSLSLTGNQSVANRERVFCYPLASISILC